jgi:cytochrome c551
MKEEFIMKTKLLTLLLGTSVILGACGGGEEPKEEAKGEASGDAETIVQQSCIGCHGENLEGKNGPDLREVGAKYDKEEIKEILINGRGGMPGVLQDADAEVVATWLIEKK